MLIGTLTFPDGKYEGKICHGMMNGWGIYTFAKGQIQEGNWYNNGLYGQCIIKYPSGNTYDGFICRHKRNGKGKMIYADGKSREGNWYDDNPEGRITLIDANGDIHYEFWHNGAIVGKCE